MRGPCLLALAACLAAAAPAEAGPVFALAQGAPPPVFAVLGESPPAAPPVPSQLPSRRAALEAELRADEAALARVTAAERDARARLRRIARRLSSTALLSARLDTARSVSQLTSVASIAGAAVQRLRDRVARLNAALAVGSQRLDSFAVPASSVGARAVAIAEQYLGVPYVWGGADPSTGFDCSGLVMFVYARLGIRLTHYAAAQYAETRPIDPAALEPGDLVFFRPQWNGPGHVGIYVGGDELIEAPHTGDVVKLASLSDEASSAGFVGATRPA